MKKKIILIISLISQMIVNIYAIINANEIVKSLKESFEGLLDVYESSSMESYFSTVTNMFTNKYIYGMCTISMILISILLLITLFGKNLYSKKTLLIVLTIITFVTSIYDISYIFIILDIILFSKLEKDTNYKEEKKEIPKIEKRKNSIGDIIIAILMILIYAFLMSNGFGLFDIIPSKYGLLLSISIYVLLISFSIFFFYEELNKCFKLFIKNFKAYMIFIFNKLKYGYIIYFIMAFIALILNGNISSNQEELMSMSKFLVVPLAILYAPLVEESVFRISIRRIIKNDILFIIVSALSFGLIHTIGEGSLYNVLVASLPYCTLGGILAYLYVKSNNPTTNMFVHCLQNTIASVIMIFI